MKKLLIVFVAMFAMMACTGNSTKSVVKSNDTTVVDSADSVVDSVATDSVIVK